MLFSLECWKVMVSCCFFLLRLCHFSEEELLTVSWLLGGFRLVGPCFVLLISLRPYVFSSLQSRMYLHSLVWSMKVWQESELIIAIHSQNHSKVRFFLFWIIALRKYIILSATKNRQQYKKSKNSLGVISWFICGTYIFKNAAQE